MGRGATAAVDPYLGERHVYQAHRAGVPNLKNYFRELWSRRDFAIEMATTQMRAAHTNTVLGQLWLILNPLLLSLVYFILVTVIRGGNSSRGDLAHIMSGLFLFFYVSGAIRSSTTSVISGGKLILNMSFPKMLLPMSAVYLAFRRFLPTLVVYAVFHIVFARAVTWWLLLLPLAILFGTLFGFGLGMLMATLQVYFRDIANFLPYVIRIWLYLSPVLWTTTQLTSMLPQLAPLAWLNPLYSIFGLWTDALNGIPMQGVNLGLSAAWGVGLLIVGALVFTSREREFSVRL